MTQRDSVSLNWLLRTYPKESRSIIDEVFTAEWIEDTSEGRRPGSHFYCARCHTMQGVVAKFQKYCPECGYRMVMRNGNK